MTHICKLADSLYAHPSHLNTAPPHQPTKNESKGNVTGLMDGKQLRLCVPISPSAFAERTSERNLLLLLASGVQGEESGGSGAWVKRK
jgi:hypothetical protein